MEVGELDREGVEGAHWGESAARKRVVVDGSGSLNGATRRSKVARAGFLVGRDSAIAWPEEAEYRLVILE
jgi:hypothetical protein